MADKLENLNLTVEVRDGMLNHSGANRASTLEGQLIKYADRIAYINHDIDDAIRAGILKAGDLPRDLTEILGDTHSKRISTMVNAVIAYGTDGDIGMTEPHWEATKMCIRDSVNDPIDRLGILNQTAHRQGIDVYKRQIFWGLMSR